MSGSVDGLGCFFMMLENQVSMASWSGGVGRFFVSEGNVCFCFEHITVPAR